MRAFFIAGLILIICHAASGQNIYTVTDLGTLGGIGSYAYGINDAGTIVGFSYISGQSAQHAFIYRKGVMSDLGTFGGKNSVAFGVNDSGAVIGYSDMPGDTMYHAFLFQHGSMSDLGTLGGKLSVASAINDYGTIVGRSSAAGQPGELHAFSYNNGTMSDLGTLGGYYSVAWGINNAGINVGHSLLSDNNTVHAFQDQNGSMSDLNTTGGFSVAYGINSAGSIVGKSDSAISSSTSHAFLYESGTTTNLGTLGGTTGAATAINDDGTIVGYSATASYPNHAFIYQDGFMTDLNTLADTAGGWVLVLAYAVNNTGEIVGMGYHHGLTRAFLLTPGGIAVTSPAAGVRWIAGSNDTIRWTGGKASQFLDIQFSADSGVNYSVIASAVPADSGFYVWNVPDTLTTRAKVKLVNASTSAYLAESDTFRIKGYVLTRMTPDGHYEAFNPAIHGWSYQNGSLWPQSWWSQFHYLTALDPNTNSAYPDFFHSVPDSTFIDWPLWVNVFSVSSSYWSTTFDIYRDIAANKWKSNGSVHSGSCFGFAAASFLAFNFKNQFLANNPGVPNFTTLFSIPLNNSIQSTINGYYAHQFGKQTYDNDVIGKPKDPRTTLQEIENMFIGDVTDVRTISIFNRSGAGGGGHTLAPIRITKDNTGPSRYRLYLYDSNNPGLNTPYILIDSLNNTWTDFTGLGPTWTGTNHFYLEIPVSNYLNTPIMGKQQRPPDNIKDEKDPKGGTGVNNIEFYNTSKANVMYTASDGKRIGLVNGVVTDEIDNGIAIFDKNGKVSDPVGYYIPDDAYAIVLSNMTDTIGKAYLAAFKGNVMYDYERGNIHPSQVDRFTVNEGLSIASPDSAEKRIDLEVLADLGSSERIFYVRNTQLSQNDSLYLSEQNQDKLVIKNFGNAKVYDLEIQERSSNGQGTFRHASIALLANTSQTIVPQWDSLGRLPLKIFVDLDNNGTVDDSLSIVDQTTGVKSRGALEIPAEFILEQNYPNPFNPSTTIRYGLPKSSYVKLTVYNTLGEMVAQLVNEQQEAGYHDIIFRNEGLASGVYFYRLQAGSSNQTRRFLLLR